jgi:prephenate dehydratase/chorismate mutase/prephenate dehydratase
MDLKGIRKNIDQIDRELVGLLNRRMEYVLRTKKLKECVTETNREAEVLRGVRHNPFELLSGEFSEKLYQEIIGESKRLQEKSLRLIGFQGEHGAYSEVAVREFDAEAVAIPHSEFGEVFTGVESGILDLGVVPVENSLAGNVTQVDDLLIETELHVTAEIGIAIHHCLLALPETDWREVRVVYSHPQALAQCRGFLSRTELEVRPYYDTAGAALMLAKERPRATAVVASSLCAKLYNLEILKENIEDHQSNRTRFLVIAKEPRREGGNKCSIVFSTAHTPGALFQVLKEFSGAGINLTRIESRPMPSQPGGVGFLLDFQGARGDNSVEAVIEKLNRDTVRFRVLGWYDEAVALFGGAA